MSHEIPLFKVFMSDTAPEKVTKVLLSGHITQGPVVEQYEHALQHEFNRDYVVTVNSATSGLILALRLLSTYVPPVNEVEVLCTPLTCTATNFPVLTQGFQIKWVDVNPQTCNMDLTDLKQKLTSTTRIVMLVHFAGYPVDMEEIERIKIYYQEKFGRPLYVIEDCAHALFAEYGGNYLPYGNNIGVFSTQAIKHLTTADGGIVIVSDKSMYDRAILLRWYGIDRNRRTLPGGDFRMEPDIPEWGYKFHMNDVNATIGLCNLPHIKSNIKRGQQIARHYEESFKFIDEIGLMQYNQSSSPVYWIFPIRIQRKCEYIKYMKDNGVMVSQVHNRNDIHSCLQAYKCKLPQLDQLVEKMVCIPCGWWLTDKDVNKIITLTIDFVQQTHIYIRELKHDDFGPCILDIISQLGFDVRDISKARYTQVLNQPNQFILVAIEKHNENERIVGCARIVIDIKWKGSVAHLEDVVVDKDYRHKGIATQLIQKCIDIAESHSSSHKIVLNCKPELINLYTKCGFNNEGQLMCIRLS